MKTDIEITDDQMIAIAMMGAFLTAYGTVRGTAEVVENVTDVIEDAVDPIVSTVKRKGIWNVLGEAAKGLNPLD